MTKRGQIASGAIVKVHDQNRFRMQLVSLGKSRCDLLGRRSREIQADLVNNAGQAVG